MVKRPASRAKAKAIEWWATQIAIGGAALLVFKQSIPPPEAIMDYYDLGTYSRKITTNSEAAQTWFDRGLVMSPHWVVQSDC